VGERKREREGKGEREREIERERAPGLPLSSGTEFPFSLCQSASR